MAKLKKVKDLLSQKEPYLSYFTVNSHDSIDNIRRMLLLVASLEQKNPDDADTIRQLKDKEVRQLAQYYQELSNQSSVKKEVRKYTEKDFFYSLLKSSPYHKEIVLDHDVQNKFPQSDFFNASYVSEAKNIQGFAIDKDETFVSTRHYSEDKEQFSQVLFKNGTFLGIERNLNPQQKTDLTFEMVTQCLMHLSPDIKELQVTGSLESVHKMQAAFLYLKQEAGPLWDAKFSELSLALPPEIEVQETYDEAYIQKHLGDLSIHPMQLTQLWRYLNPNEAIQKRGSPFFRFKFGFLLDSEELSPEDKEILKQALVELDLGVEKIEVPRTYTAAQEKEERYNANIQTLIDYSKKYPSLNAHTAAFQEFKRDSEEVSQQLLQSLRLAEEKYRLKIEPLQQAIKEEGGKFIKKIAEDFQHVLKKEALLEERQVDSALKDTYSKTLDAMLAQESPHSLEQIYSCAKQLSEMIPFLKERGLILGEEKLQVLALLETRSLQPKEPVALRQTYHEMRGQLRALREQKAKRVDEEGLSLTTEQQQEVKEWVEDAVECIKKERMSSHLQDFLTIGGLLKGATGEAFMGLAAKLRIEMTKNLELLQERVSSPEEVHRVLRILETPPTKETLQEDSSLRPSF